MSVFVYCPICKGGKNVIWEGTIIDWGVELSMTEPPEWYEYVLRHEQAHPGHVIMVEYPDRVIPLRYSKEK